MLKGYISAVKTVNGQTVVKEFKTLREAITHASKRGNKSGTVTGKQDGGKVFYNF